MNLRWILTGSLMFLGLAAGCSSGEDDTGPATGAQPAAPATSAVSDSVPPKPVSVAAATIDRKELDSAAALTPDELVDRYSAKCNAGNHSQTCQALRRELELRYLDVLLKLRAAHRKLDPQLYRVAAQGEYPQLVVAGLRGLLLVPGTIADDDQKLIVDALNSPYVGVRSTVIQFGSNVPGVAERWPRIASDPDSGGFAFLDLSRDTAADPAVIGSYPDARYCYFASTDERPWFTTGDPPEKVIAFLTREGGEAFTADGLKTKMQQDASEAMMKAASSGDQNKIMEAMLQSTIDWSRVLDDVNDTGEIRFIPKSGDRMIAVFADNLLHATSIVAVQAPPRRDMPEVPPEVAQSGDLLPYLEKEKRRQQELQAREELISKVREGAMETENFIFGGPGYLK